jgi:benzoylformate decarboxylase
MTGRSAFLTLLADEGITHLFGNPGTTELPIMHALEDFPNLTFVMAMQESLVVAMADGYSRASGKLVACNVHVAPGLGNAMGSLYNAKFTGTPIILTAGQQEQGHGLMEPLLYGPLVRLAEPLVKWSVEVTRLEDLPRIVRRAAKIATTPPTGPVFISLPGDILNAEANIDLLRSSRVDSRTRPSDASLDRALSLIRAAVRPVIIVGDEIVKSDAMDIAGGFASALGCPVFQQTIAYSAHFLSEHPCFMGALPRNQEQVKSVLGQHDLLIVLGADPVRMSMCSPVEPMPPNLDVIQIGLVDWDIAKNFPVTLGLQADVRSTLEALVAQLSSNGGDRRNANLALTGNWTTHRSEIAATVSKLANCNPIEADWLTLQLVDALPENTILIDEALTSAKHLLALYPLRDRYGYHALASGGIGWGLPAAVGAGLANPGRPVVCYSGDGSAMYSIQSLWTAAHHELPLTFVIANNSGYRIIKQRLQALHRSNHHIGMDFKDPPVNFAELARSMGLDAIRITEPHQLPETLKSAFARPGTKLIEVMVDGSV